MNAGIVPKNLPKSATRKRFPRERGDSPSGRLESKLAISGFPVNAGIVPSKPVEAKQSQRFPRERGDSPFAARQAVVFRNKLFGIFQIISFILGRNFPRYSSNITAFKKNSASDRITIVAVHIGMEVGL